MLMDQEARNFYDMYGEDGVAFHKAWQEAKPNEVLQNMGPVGIFCFCCSNCCCVLFLLLFPILLCIKVSSNNDWLWSFVFSPLWIVDTIVVLMLCVWPLLPLSMSKGDPLSNCKWELLVQAVFLVVFQVFVCIKLDGADWPWAVVFCPMFAFQAVCTGQALWACMPAQHTEATKVKMAGSTCGYPVYILFLLIQQVLWWGLWLLVQMQLDGDLKLSWWIVLSPAFGILACWIYSSTQSRMVVSNDPDEKAYEQAFSRWKVALAIVLLMVIVFGALLAEGTNGFSIWAVWAPVFAVSGLFLCALCITSLSLYKKELHSQDEDLDSSEGWADGEGNTPREDERLVDDDPAERPVI